MKKIILLIKSHVSGYTRKDGTVVAAHDRQGGPVKDWRDEENWHSRTMARMKTLDSDELRYVLKDATEAADAGEKMGSRKAGQYRDEAHYAAMELHRRKKDAEGFSARARAFEDNKERNMDAAIRWANEQGEYGTAFMRRHLPAYLVERHGLDADYAHKVVRERFGH